MTLQSIAPFALALAIITLAVALFLFRPDLSLGSVGVGNEYNATTTYSGHTQEVRLLQTGPGALGSVIITGDNTGTMQFYNATTSNISLRTNNTATSSLLVADFPASSPEGTYTFDTAFTTGLIVVTSGAEATSTITWR